jgi:hypothetical protein
MLGLAMKSLFTLSLSLLLATASAAPAHYWTWRSKLDGKIACSPTPLGHGWEKTAGPFRDARCEKVIRQR